MIKYSALTNGFYDSDIHSELPADAIEITTDEYQSLLNGQSNGKIISADSDGKPVLTDPSEPTTDQLALSVRAKRDQLIAETDYLVMPDYPITAEKLASIKEYRQQLRDVTKQSGFPTQIDWPSMSE